MPESDRAIPEDWGTRVDELRKVQDMIARVALLRNNMAEPPELWGWMVFARTLYTTIQTRINEISPMTDKPFTED